MRNAYITWERKYNDRYWCFKHPREVTLHCLKELSGVLQVRENKKKARVIRRKKMATLGSVRSGTVLQRINRKNKMYHYVTREYITAHTVNFSGAAPDVYG